MEQDLKRTSEELRIILRDDHMRLFVGPAMPLAPPWGSVYLDEDNLLARESTKRLESFLRSVGVHYAQPENQPLDHISLCLSALSVFSERMAGAAPPSQTQADTLRIFLEEHLGTWVFRCLELTSERAETDFYKGLGIMTGAFFTSVMEKVEAKHLIVPLYY